ncbi:MAG: site-specific integrase [Clostridiales bacterium]|nr:site-specific integrase [Clostridiales bacterium]
MNYETWLNEWLESFIKPSCKKRTYERYQQVCTLHIIPALGEYETSALSVMELQKFITRLLYEGNMKTGAGLAPNFINTIISVLQNSLKTAYLTGITNDYVANKIKRPKSKEKQVDCFSVSEQKRLENYALNHKKDKMFGVVLCLYTGLRVGELLALKWSDIDFSTRLLSISKTCYDGIVNGKYVRMIDSPKTSHSHRVIPLPKQILPYLKNLKKRTDCEYVISDKGKPVFVRSYQRTFELMLKKLGIAHKGFHSLRHTFATRALECGMDVKTLSELLGHKNATVTLNRYAHSLLEHKTDMMNRLGKLL